MKIKLLPIIFALLMGLLIPGFLPTHAQTSSCSSVTEIPQTECEELAHSL